jgi:hypothetical protein
MIGKQHLLLDTSNRLILLKINCETWEANVISRPSCDIKWNYDIIVDQVESRKVFIYDKQRFVIGKLIGDEIVFDSTQNFNFGYYLECKKLAGNQMCGLRYMDRNDAGNYICQYRKIDLDTLTGEAIDVPFNSSNNVFSSYLVSFNFCY